MGKCVEMRLNLRRISGREKALQPGAERPFRVHIQLFVGVVGVWPANEHIAVGDAAAFGHAHADAVTVRLYHGFKVSGGIEPVFQGVLGGILCGYAGEYRQVYAEAVGVAAVDHGLTFLFRVVPGIMPVGETLRGGHQSLADR